MKVNVDTVNVEAEALKYMVAEEPSPVALQYRLGVVKELTKVRPPAEVLEEMIVSTDLPRKVATCVPAFVEKLIVPVPRLQMTGPVFSRIVNVLPNTQFAL